jgi:PfaD family protein
MYHGIASTAMVIEMGRAGMIGFLGSGGLSLQQIEKGIETIKGAIGASGLSWGANLLYSPNDSELEEAMIDLYLRHRVRRVSAAAFMKITPGIVRYICTGLKTDCMGNVIRRNHVFAKLSRPEVARLFMSPPPGPILEHLVSKGLITKEEFDLATRIPLAEDITVEADSGGHTDNQTLTTLFPTILCLRDQMMIQYGYFRTIRVGAAGGLGTPAAVAAAFALGASYVLTGSINQSAVESGMSSAGKEMLARAGIMDVAMAPAADMFELGAKVQVLRHGTLFCGRAAQLDQIYRRYPSIEDVPLPMKEQLEKEVFRTTLEDIRSEVYRYFKQRNPMDIEKAKKDPRYHMALIFRWYLGKAALWAIEGDASRRMDFQICCGPAMGAFNSWVAGSFLQEPGNRSVVNIALNLLEGAAVITRAQQLRTYGVAVPESAFFFRPRPLLL